MFLPVITVGPVVALGATLVYCAKGRDETKKPGAGFLSSTKKSTFTPKPIKSLGKSSHSSKKGPRSISRSSKGPSSKQRRSQKEPLKGRSDEKSSKGKRGDKSDKSKKDPKKKKTEEDKKTEKAEKEKKKNGHNEQKIETPFKLCDLKEKISASVSLAAAPQTVEMKMIPSELNWKTGEGLSHLHIVNNSDERRAIKAKCTDNLIYRVHPVHGFIAPGESFKVNVLRNKAAGKSDVLVFLTTKAKDKKDPRECFADKTQPTEMLVMPLLSEKVESCM